MTTTEPQRRAPVDRDDRAGRAAWADLARIEVARYARRPGFVIGALLTYAALLPYLDGGEPTDELSMIAPAALIGLAGITVSSQRVWASDRCADVAGPTPVGQGHRTLAHLIACLVPFTAGLGFVAVTFARSFAVPPRPDGYSALMSQRWVAATWFGLGALSCLGGPVLGVVIARRVRWAAAPIVASVATVAVVIVFQGLFEPLRRARVVMPWTYWGGPFGIEGDPQRSIVLTGSPGWWVAYLLALCGIGACVALRGDPAARTPRSMVVLTGLVAAAVVCCLLAMWTGTPETLVNPRSGDGPVWGG